MATVPRVVTSAITIISAVATVAANAAVVVSSVVALIASATVLVVLVTVVTTIAFVVAASAAVIISSIATPIVAIAATIAIVILVVAVILARSIVSSSVLLRSVRRLRVMLLGGLLQLAFLVVDKVIEYRHRVLVAMDDLQRLDSLRIGHLLGVSRVRNGLVFVILQHHPSQLSVRDVFDVDPAHLEGALPLVLRPNTGYGVVIHGSHHLRYTAEMPGSVDREEQIHHSTLFLAFAIRLIQPLVAVFG